MKWHWVVVSMKLLWGFVYPNIMMSHFFDSKAIGEYRLSTCFDR